MVNERRKLKRKQESKENAAKRQPKRKIYKQKGVFLDLSGVVHVYDFRGSREIIKTDASGSLWKITTHIDNVPAKAVQYDLTINEYGRWFFNNQRIIDISENHFNIPLKSA